MEIPNFDSERVTFSYSYDNESTGRYLRHQKHLNIDKQIVLTQTWIVDDDWANCSEDEPDKLDMWNRWLEKINQNSLKINKANKYRGYLRPDQM